MLKVLMAVALMIGFSAGPGLAADCSKYRFGSQEWWQCQNQFGPD